MKTRLDTVVVVDDEPPTLRALQRSLDGAFDVAAFCAAEPAMERVRRGGVSAVLSDISMPGMSGIELLSAVRAHDPDLPVMLITGTPSLESATRAIEHGVFRYLPKPFDADQLVSLVRDASRLHGLAQLKRSALELGGAPSVFESVGADRGFQLALDQLWLAFQPIISIRGRGVYGYEALMRSSAPSFRSPSDLLEAAERLNALNRLGRAVRRQAAAGLRDAASDALLFVNLHPQDLFDPELTAANSPLVAIAHRVVLEITERASLDDASNLKPRMAALRALGFRVAVDDLGAGYAGLSSFVSLEPDIVKLDMSLTRGIDQSPVKKKLVGSLSAMCREMGIAVVVEGVETMGELDALLALKCDLFQGFLFARPARSLVPIAW